MRYDLFRFDVGRDVPAPARARISMFTVMIVAACTVLVAASTLVALTYGWDYRLAVMLGTIAAVVLACFSWATLPADRVADRLAVSLAGTLAAALLAVYASDWLDWTPLDLDDALAGFLIGLLLLVAVPVRQALRYEAWLPTPAGLALILLALAPAAWAAFVSDEHSLGRTASYWRILAPCFGLALAVAALGTGFALRRRSYGVTIALLALAAWDAAVLAFDYDSPRSTALRGETLEIGLIIAAAYAWMRTVRSVPLPAWAHAPAGPVLATAVRRVRIARPTVAGLGAAALGLAPLAVLALVDTFDCFDLWRPDRHELVVVLTLALGLLFAAAAAVLKSRRLYRSALLASVVTGGQPMLLGYESSVDMETVAWAAAVGTGLLAITVAVWRARTIPGPTRPTELLGFLALGTVVVFVAALEPLEYFLAAATLGVWWWFYQRRGIPVIARGALERFAERQPRVRFVLGASVAATIGVYLLLLQAAVYDATGAMLLADLAERRLYRVPETTFARAMLNDEYLWRDDLARRRVMEANPDLVVEARRNRRDQWSHATELFWVRFLDNYEAYDEDGLRLRKVPGGRHVLYVHGGSPAQRAGVRRGDVIRAVNGVALYEPGTVWPALEGPTRLQLASPDGKVREVTLVPSRYRRSALSVERVVDRRGRKVGYLELSHFDQRADDFIDAAERLRQQGIDELVLDLRMNPGGYLHTSARIASAIGGKRLNGRVYERIVHNDRYRDRDRDIRFVAPLRGDLSLPRVFVITSEESCSASESLISGLAPHLEVVTIGGTTCGKPVGSQRLDYGEHAYWVISFRGVNAHGEGDYFDGIRPTCGAADDPSRDFGDPEEASFKAALHYIEHGRCPDPTVWP